MSAKKVNAKGSAVKIKRFFEILEKHNAVNYGDMKTGNSFNSSRDEIYKNIKDTSIVHFVVTEKREVAAILNELAEAHLGTSVVVSGLIDDTEWACKKAGLKMHTVEFSGGIYGRLDTLPEKEVLELTTMCGHGMVAANLVRDMVRKIKKGKKSLEDAAQELARPCQCGVFNPKRAEKLLRKMV